MYLRIVWGNSPKLLEIKTYNARQNDSQAIPHWGISALLTYISNVLKPSILIYIFNKYWSIKSNTRESTSISNFLANRASALFKREKSSSFIINGCPVECLPCSYHLIYRKWGKSMPYKSLSLDVRKQSGIFLENNELCNNTVWQKHSSGTSKLRNISLSSPPL